MACMRIPACHLLLLSPGTKAAMRAVAAVRCEAGAEQRSRGAYHHACHDAVLALCARVQAAQSHGVGSRARLSLDCFGFSAAILAARISRRLSTRVSERQTLDGLIAKLARYRVRAKRVFLRVRGLPAYEDEKKHWLEFVHWVREFAAWERQVDRWDARRYADRSFPTYTKRVIALAIKTAHQALSASGQPVPADGELRRLVRAAIRAIRRGRAMVSVKDVITATPEGLEFLAGFIGRRFRTAAAPRVEEIDFGTDAMPQEEEV